MKNKADKIIKFIENLRKKNNKNWMDLLRLAFKENPKKPLKFYLKFSQKIRC